ncbi:1,4-alpha-glucan branching protein GlgB [Nocardia farcinica]|uniref:1,4-alpha-glucan branching enzyme GlgB n=1 Tax=Nocardia farcinica (strain IFM 10152) TaxID=247156 RepID=GLGB_NOCFA|nr:RecName: Full=1,4-alpha-glucan branching enzyme GlgB; AltName: Full=1,4-alpha-D-glucan:1,4-alpha-D-glucan 6-glucosyl-transferase; AltName: Full=Alpha-(1->4)-glucan branching enzyme; AltName: Full=Glycogen branching enzyme; Short=BE [Nocardia farcinica IFM 10152]BAD55923.1 putative 1,4-alpha-glucan branching enzyme [Nocardia farcinica IFM 10152]
MSGPEDPADRRHGEVPAPRRDIPRPLVERRDLMLLAAGTHRDPHTVLGAHPHPDGTVVRVLRPHAAKVSVRVGGVDHPLDSVGYGVFAAVLPHPELMDYRIVTEYPGGPTVIAADGFRFLPTLGELDLHLIGEGRHEHLWHVLGAHPRRYTTLDGPVSGTSFAVWAPNARGVTVIGDFDGWSGNTAPMRALGTSGVWEVFVPDVGSGTKYKYRVHGADGRVVDHADPLAFATELPPATASVVTGSDYTWQDAQWLERRRSTDPTRSPMSVYEVHLGSWRPGLGYRELAEQLADYVRAAGYTHVELLPVAEHPFGGSWGYQVTSYYAPTARFGSPDDFRAFVDHLHGAGIGVLLDWVPAHFPRDEWALARFDGTPLYEHPDPRRGEQLDWGTYVFDFGRNEVRNFLVANARFWIEEFHIDGLRVDAVASMLYLDYSRGENWEPNIHGGRENLEAVAFLRELNDVVHRAHPGVVTIAEESTTWPGVTRGTEVGGLGFTMKWNMGWMHDTLGFLARDPIHRSWHHNEITFSLVYAWSENYVLPISHDEVVHGKGTLWTRMPGDDFAKAAGVRALLAYMWAHPGKQLLFMGQDFGQFREWSHDRGLDWGELDNPLHRGIATAVRDLNRVYRATPALWSQDTTPGGYAWIEADDRDRNVLAFLRYGSDGSTVACVFNFSGALHGEYRVGLPIAGEWTEILNTDAADYGGSGVGNYGVVRTEEIPWHGRPVSATVALAPNSAVWLAAPRA